MDKIIKETQPTIYKSKKNIAKGNVFYFHGGGLLFGTKEDLPSYHIDRITESGYNIYSFNYPLAPETKLPEIMDFIVKEINTFQKKTKLPYFLWGRSAGAYLSLLAPLKGLDKKPSGIISYYGYGFLTSDWYKLPNSHYLKYQGIDKSMADSLIQDKKIYSYPVYPRFLLYLYTRQKGNWIDHVWDGSMVDFLKEYSLNDRDLSGYPPTFLAHGRKDPDVPFEESIKLSKLIKNSEFHSFTTDEHDFDRDVNNKNTIELLDKTLAFLDRKILSGSDC